MLKRILFALLIISCAPRALAETLEDVLKVLSLCDTDDVAVLKACVDAHMDAPYDARLAKASAAMATCLVELRLLGVRIAACRQVRAPLVSYLKARVQALARQPVTIHAEWKTVLVPEDKLFAAGPASRETSFNVLYTTHDSCRARLVVYGELWPPQGGRLTLHVSGERTEHYYDLPAPPQRQSSPSDPVQYLLMGAILDRQLRDGESLWVRNANGSYRYNLTNSAKAMSEARRACQSYLSEQLKAANTRKPESEVTAPESKAIEPKPESCPGLEQELEACPTLTIRPL